MRAGTITRGVLWLVPGVVACATITRPALPSPIPTDARVRVLANELPPGWHSGHLVQSSEGCRVVTVATTPESHPVVVLNMGQIRQLQLSQALPPPDWWAEPTEAEGWTELDMVTLREEGARCRSHYP